MIKNFFGIESKYKFELMDLLSLLIAVNVILVIMGIWWAPIFGLTNNILSILSAIKKKTHINFYIMQIFLMVLNIYFLTL